MIERQQLDSERGDVSIIDAADAMPDTHVDPAMNVIEEMVDAHFGEMHDDAAAARRVASSR